MTPKQSTFSCKRENTKKCNNVLSSNPGLDKKNFVYAYATVIVGYMLSGVHYKLTVSHALNCKKITK